MDVTHVLKDPTRNRLVLIGKKKPGTRVPMAAAFACSGVKVNRRRGLNYRCLKPKQLWKLEIPVGNPMEAKYPITPSFAIRAGTLYVTYDAEDSSVQYYDAHRVAAFALETGKRLWDWKLRGNDSDTVEGIVPTGSGTVAVSSYILHLLDAQSGKHLLTLER
jgi:hypothetical protein